MQKITFKKKWVEKLNQMTENKKDKCVIALFEFLDGGQLTSKIMKMGDEIVQFINEIAVECREDERRREIQKARREEKKRLAEKSKSTEQQCFVGSRDEYAKCPSLFIFDAFMHYLLSSSGAGLRPQLPGNKSLGETLIKFRKWAIKTARINDITKLNVFRDQFVRNLSQFA